jgi:hypothetical protein
MGRKAHDSPLYKGRIVKSKMGSAIGFLEPHGLPPFIGCTMCPVKV